MNGKKYTNLIIKEWTTAIGSGNGRNHHPFITYSESAPNEKPCFSVGETWTIATDKGISLFRVIATEDVTIPAGRHKCFKIVEEIKNSGIKNYYWFASSIGLVKCETHRMTAVLQSCSAPYSLPQGRLG